MKKLLAIVFSFLLLFGCTAVTREPAASPPVSSAGTVPPSPTSAQSPVPSSPTSSPQPTPTPVDPIDTLIASLSDDEIIGQMLIYSMRGTESPGGDLTALIEKTHCANFILFGGNCINPEQVAGLIQRTNEYNPHEDIPFFYCIDEEGGRVSRLKLGLPSAKETALSENPAQKAYENGEKTANALREIGIQWDLAPVFDISKGESALGDRIFGSDGETAGALALSFARGLQENGVAATAKHFPGIGHTPVDSHEAFPVIEKNREELESYELVPFRAAMDNNVDVIMVGHVIMPAFDTQYPATISHKIITGLLREEWDYNGLIMTDDMAMSSMKESYPAGEACLQAVLAGVDMVLIADNSSGVFDAMQQAARDGVLTRERLEESMRRILAFKWQYQ